MFMKPDRRASQATIMEVALAAGVSLATVSRTCNHPEKVKPETREKIERIIKEKGYKPNLNAKSLASNKSTTVAVVVPELTRSSIAGLVDGIADCANRRGYFVRLFVNNSLKDGVHESEKDFWSTLMASVVDGVLYINDEMTEESIELIKNSSIPVVLTNIVCSDPEIPYVSIDYFKAAYEMTKEMLTRGNKKIWMINTVRKYVVNDLKVAGYKKAMEEAGLEPISNEKFSSHANISNAKEKHRFEKPKAELGGALETIKLQGRLLYGELVFDSNRSCDGLTLRIPADMLSTLTPAIFALEIERWRRWLLEAFLKELPKEIKKKANEIRERLDDIYCDILEHEKEILKAQALNEGKPAAVVDKMVEGRIKKFYKEVCLLEQEFVKRVTSDSLIQYVADRIEVIDDKYYLIGLRSDMTEVKFLLGTPGSSAAESNVKHILSSPYWHISLTLKEVLSNMYSTPVTTEDEYETDYTRP